MAPKKGKAVSFNAMVKFFMQNYNIPTKKDIDRLSSKIDRLEKLIRNRKGNHRQNKSERTDGIPSGAGSVNTASGTVLEIIKKHKEGVGIADIGNATGYGDKKLRNIIFRLNKLEKIERVTRGIYKAVK